jgi:hypothetical protein
MDNFARLDEIRLHKVESVTWIGTATCVPVFLKDDFWKHFISSVSIEIYL